MRVLNLGLSFRFWVAFCVMALSVFYRSLAGFDAASPSLAFGSSERIILASTLALYNLDGTFDCSPSDPTLNVRRRAHLTLTWASSLWLVFELLALASIWCLPILVGFLVCGMYAPRLVLGGHEVRLKSIPGVKAPFVGMAVGTAVVLVPHLCSEAPRSALPLGSTLAIWGSLCCFCTANALLFDLPDLAEDRRDGVPTTVAQHGPRRAKKAVLACVLLGMGLASLGPRKAVPPLLALALALVVALPLVGTHTKKTSLALWVDGSLCLPLILRILLR